MTLAILSCATLAAADPLLRQQRRLVTTAVDQDAFGQAVGIDGDTAIVGSGANFAAIYQRDAGGPGNWGLVKTLEPSVLSGSTFGIVVAISGDLVVVGVPGDDVAGAGFNAGSAYIFGRDEGGPDNWGEVKQLVASDGGEADTFGFAVAVEGDTVVVGARDGEFTTLYPGAAYVFDRNSGGPDNWGEVKKIVPSDQTPGSRFGQAVAVHGDTTIIGALHAAYVFERDLGGLDHWGERKKLQASCGACDLFGSAIALEGDRALVAARFDDENGSNSGSTHILERNEGGADNWGQVALLLASNGADGDGFGSAVALDGDSALIGAWGTEAGGTIYFFTRDTGGPGNWGEVQKLQAPDAHSNYYSGGAVALSDGVALSGAPVDGPGTTYLIEPHAVRMFVTPADYAPDFGGLSGADAICRAEATAGNAPGIWKALLSVDGTEKFGRLPSGIPVLRIDGAALADDASALAAGVAHPLDAEPAGGTAPVGSRVWTGDSNGDESCLDFTATAGEVGTYGITSETDSDWHGAGTEACTEANRLYCFRSACPAASDVSCIDSFEKGSLVVSETLAGKEKLRARLSKGPALSQSDLGNPLGIDGTAYLICFYNGADELIAEMEIDRAGSDCAGKPCWKAIGGAPPLGKGYIYKDKDRSADGLQVLSFKGGAEGKSKIQIKAGNNAPKGQTHLMGRIAEALAGSSQATVQIHGNDMPACLGITFDQTKKDLGLYFQATK